MLKLSDQEWFARGGNRLCYVHPEDPQLCLKLARHLADPTYVSSRRRVPLDENQKEAEAYSRFSPELIKKILLPRFAGMFDTDLGVALACTLFRDEDGRISRTLENVLWTEGMTEQLGEALKQFQSAWSEYGFVTRKILPHNLVVVRAQHTPWRLAMIDGFTVSWWGRLTLPLSRSAASNANELGVAAMEVIHAKQDGTSTLAKSIANRVERWDLKNS